MYIDSVSVPPTYNKGETGEETRFPSLLRGHDISERRSFCEKTSEFSQLLSNRVGLVRRRKLRPSFEERSLTLPPGLAFCKKRYL